MFCSQQPSHRSGPPNGYPIDSLLHARWPLTSGCQFHFRWRSVSLQRAGAGPPAGPGAALSHLPWLSGAPGPSVNQPLKEYLQTPRVRQLQSKACPSPNHAQAPCFCKCQESGRWVQGPGVEAHCGARFLPKGGPSTPAAERLGASRNTVAIFIFLT